MLIASRNRPPTLTILLIDVLRSQAARYHRLIWGGIAIALFFASCSEEHKGTVIARVGSAELTREHALSYIDTSNRNVELQLKTYISSWINTELINQEAQRLKIDQREEVNRSVNDVKRQLVSQFFLDHYLNDDSADIPEQELRKYFDAHQSEFITRELMIKLHLAIFSSREPASIFATTFMKTSNWDSALAESHIASSIVGSPAPQYYSQHTLFPPELWKIATTLSPNEISFPVKISSGYAVIQVVGAAQEGKPSPFELVRNEVRTRIVVEAQREKYAELLGTLRKRYDVEIFTGTVHVSDTSHLQTHE